jgi:hypothetical protein
MMITNLTNNSSNKKRPIPRTEEHRKHLSLSAKKWRAVPTNKERMSKIQTGIHRRSRSEESKKKISESTKRYYLNKRKIGKDKEVGDNKPDLSPGKIRFGICKGFCYRLCIFPENSLIEFIGCIKKLLRVIL